MGKKKKGGRTVRTIKAGEQLTDKGVNRKMRKNRGIKKGTWEGQTMIYGETERSQNKIYKTMELGNRCRNRDKRGNMRLKQGEPWDIVCTGEKMHKLVYVHGGCNEIQGLGIRDTKTGLGYYSGESCGKGDKVMGDNGVRNKERNRRLKIV